MYAQYIKFKTYVALTSLKDIFKINDLEIEKISIRNTREK